MKLLSPEEKKQQVQDAIERIKNGEVLSVSSSSFSSVNLCIGDFREIGWSKRCSDLGGLWYEWNGPTHIIVGDCIIPSPGTTEYWEVDWS